jgi:hypothetical protein
MLDNVKQRSPRVYGSKAIKLAHDPHYDVVEMSSSAGCVVLGLSKETGKLMDVIGPLLLPRQDHRGQVQFEDIGETCQACAFQAVAGRG